MYALAESYFPAQVRRPQIPHSVVHFVGSHMMCSYSLQLNLTVWDSQFVGGFVNSSNSIGAEGNVNGVALSLKILLFHACSEPQAVCLS